MRIIKDFHLICIVVVFEKIIKVTNRLNFKLNSSLKMPSLKNPPQKGILLALLFSTLCFNILAQLDSTKTLNEIVVNGLETNQSSLKTPVSLQKINRKEIEVLQTTSPLLILNAVAGVRMEDRSPSSYRLSIRGSSVRSPFGVRNVKVFYNDIPLSDANGNTYLNIIDFGSLSSLELIKGPASSVYGSGYGGVLRLQKSNLEADGHTFTKGFDIGSYGYLKDSYSYQLNAGKVSFGVDAATVKSNGYRDHSKVGNSYSSLTFGYNPNLNHKLNFIFLYGKLAYETPGGLTLEQVKVNRKAARFPTASLPGSAEQNAGIDQKFYLFGINHSWFVKPKTMLSTSLFFSHNKLENPFITNYEKRHEKTFGYRIIGQHEILENWQLTFGSEGIFTPADFQVFENLAGKPGNPLYNSSINASQLSHFLQSSYSFPLNFTLSAGLSFNQQRYHNVIFENQLEVLNYVGTPKLPWSSRISLLKQFNKNMSVFYAYSEGYSPPTAQEMTANFENSLNPVSNAETAKNHEIGFKFFNSPNNHFELSYYKQFVKNAIVRNVSEAGSEYFENSGKIKQNGFEFQHIFAQHFPELLISKMAFNTSLGFNLFEFSYYQSNQNDYSGNTLPGTSKWIINSNLYLEQKQGIFLNLNFNFLSRMPLNSANTIYSRSMYLTNIKLGWQYQHKIFELGIFFNLNNMLNQKYSLGYDFNALGGRYFNPAPPLNFSSGANLRFFFGQVHSKH